MCEVFYICLQNKNGKNGKHAMYSSHKEINLLPNEYHLHVGIKKYLLKKNVINYHLYFIMKNGAYTFLSNLFKCMCLTHL